MSKENTVNNFFDKFKSSNKTEITETKIEQERAEEIQKLKETPEVQEIANEIVFEDSNSILNFGKKVTDDIEKVTADILAVNGRTTSKDAAVMLKAFAGLVKKFDLQEFDLKKDQKKNFVTRTFELIVRKVKLTFEETLEKFNGMSSEIDTIILQLKKYSEDIKENDEVLSKLYSANMEYIEKIDKYIAAGDVAKERAEEHIKMVEESEELKIDEKTDLLERLEKAKQQITDQIYNLHINRAVAKQNAPAINHVHENNFNLQRNINMATSTLIPALRQNLVIGQSLQQQDMQNKVINELGRVTNELMVKNAKYTSEISADIRKTSSNAAIQIETLKECQRSIESAIENSRKYALQLEQKRVQDINALKALDIQMKNNSIAIGNLENNQKITIK